MRSLQDMMKLDGRNALVTGGVGHIGRAVGHGLAELGARVSILDMDSEACEEQAQNLAKENGNRGVGVSCDLTDETSTRQAVRQVVESTGGMDILVHCAAYVGTTQAPGWAVPFEEQSVTVWEAALKVNLTAAFTMVQEGQKALSSSGYGSVILFGSTYGMVGPDMGLYEGTSMANPAGYAASKGGVIQLVRHMATLLAPKIRVNSVSPGGVWRDQPESFHQKYKERTPMGRMAREEDLMGAVAYLASDLSQYVTGHNLVVDGGWTAW